ncbi:hypothetical protein GUJ93_ZPchr0002g24768 [Zizania palustris]|uniref:Uncharacterized protein n=1 Tax=Zizania palustris TaxID=103762 RepID=A0A8J5SD19_ZIZPA|nr:hypothetical protein GUJ93_ZPchr0002g24768 [Zizania palustris]
MQCVAAPSSVGRAHVWTAVQIFLKYSPGNLLHEACACEDWLLAHRFCQAIAGCCTAALLHQKASWKKQSADVRLLPGNPAKNFACACCYGKCYAGCCFSPACAAGCRGARGLALARCRLAAEPVRLGITPTSQADARDEGFLPAEKKTERRRLLRRKKVGQ